MFQKDSENSNKRKFIQIKKTLDCRIATNKIIHLEKSCHIISPSQYSNATPVFPSQKNPLIYFSVPLNLFFRYK